METVTFTPAKLQIGKKAHRTCSPSEATAFKSYSQLKTGISKHVAPGLKSLMPNAITIRMACWSRAS